MEAVFTLFAAATATAGAAAPAAAAGASSLGGATAAAVAAESAGGLSSFLTSSTALTALQGLSSGAAALASYGRGVLEAGSKRSQATEYDNRAIGEELSQATEADKARRALVETLGKQAVGYAASGVDLSAGSVKIAQQQASNDAEDDLETSKVASDLRVRSYRSRAAQLRAEGSLAYASGILGAAGDAASFGVKATKRG